MHRWIQRQRAAFTLVEIMIVVAIVGLLVALALPAFAKARRKSRVTAYVEQLRVLTDAIHQHAITYGTYPADSYGGALPDGMSADEVKINWATPTPLGGQWDFDAGPGCQGCKAALACYLGSGGVSLTAAEWREVDALVDDGDLSTGNFRVFLGDRYGYVIEW